MAAGAIEQIKNAEDQAEVLCRVAEEKAAEMKSAVTAKGLSQYEEEERLTREECEQKLDEIRARAVAFMKKRRAEAEAEAKTLMEQTEPRIEEAARLIVWGIIEKCQ